MRAVLLSVLCAGCGCLVFAADQPEICGSYLLQPAYCVDDVIRGPSRPYVPQPGDVMLATDDDRFWRITHNLAFAFEPHGSGIIVARPDGSLGILEAGPNDTFWCRILDVFPHLQEYEAKGPVWIRKRCTPLTPEECCRLTDFAMRQEWKRFALVRLGGQLTPLRSRGPLRTYVCGKPRGDRRNYYCSELVTEACVAAGLIDGDTARPAATYPHDLFFDQSYNHYISKHLPLAGGWEPPARWVSSPVP
jgi:hypothetical protein